MTHINEFLIGVTEYVLVNIFTISLGVRDYSDAYTKIDTKKKRVTYYWTDREKSRP